MKQRRPVQIRLSRTPASPRRGRCSGLPMRHGGRRMSRPIRPSPVRNRKSPGFLITPVKGENEMTTSSARAMLLGAAIAASMGIGYAIGAQPHMTASIGLLQSARGELAAATPNKGGHRERALTLIDQAISEVRAGIAFAGS